LLMKASAWINRIQRYVFRILRPTETIRLTWYFGRQ